MGFGKDGKGQILYESNINVGNMGALASKDLIEFGGSYHDAILEDFRILKCEYYMGLSPAQAIVIQNGPIIVGLASGQLTAAQMEEALEAVPINRGDSALEETMRPVWPLEIFVFHDPDQGPQSDLTRKGEFSPRWTFQNPTGWSWFIFNVGNAALVTGSGLTIVAKFFGVWVS